MSEELEQRLRAEGKRLPLPRADETQRARERVLAVAHSSGAAIQRRPRRLRGHRNGGFNRRRGGLALAFALAIGGAFWTGFAVASGANERSIVVRATPASVVGPGFLPTRGWDVFQTGTTAPPQAPTATAANVPLVFADRVGGLPHETLRTLGPQGVVLFATFYPAGESAALDREFPTRTLPLRFKDTTAIGTFEGTPDGLTTRRLLARVGNYDVDVLVFFGARKPQPALLAAADEQLGRLVAPGCPSDALPLDEHDLDAARRFLLDWLPSHYFPDKPADLEGATAEAILASNGPRADAAKLACGPRIAARTIEVDVTLPRVARYSASLSQLAYFMAKTPDGWVVWEQIH